MLGLAVLAVRVMGAVAPASPAAPAREPVSPVIWQAKMPDFSGASYNKEVEALISRFEESIGQKLLPGAKHRVGLKIYTDSGPGLATPIPLTRAVIATLERRGYAKADIFLVGLNQQRLRYGGEFQPCRPACWPSVFLSH